MISEKKQNRSIIRILQYIFLFLISINFMHYTNYIILLFAIVCLLSSFRKSNFNFHIEFLFIIFAFISYFYIYQLNHNVTLHTYVVFLFGPIAMYICGQITFNGKKDIGYITKYIYIIAGGLFIHGMLNTFLFINQNIDILSLNGRYVPDIWGEYSSATLQNTHFIMIISLLFYSIFITKYIIERIIIYICCIFSMYSTIITASRTILYLFVLAFCFNILLYSYLNKNKITKVIYLLIFILVLIIILTWIYDLNFAGLKDWYSSSSLVKRFEASKSGSIIENSRWIYSKIVWDNIFKYPFGNNAMKHYAHNLWLDVARLTGIIPFCFLLFYSVFALIALIKFIANKNINDRDKYLVFSIYVASMIVFFTEPIIEGIPYYFALFCFINGSIRKYIHIYSYDKIKSDSERTIKINSTEYTEI